MSRDTLVPACRIVVNGHDVTADIGQVVERLEVDTGADLADEIRLRVTNPLIDVPGRGYLAGEFAFIDSKVFQPGNEIDVWLGYGDEITYVASGIIQKWLPNFPADGIPTLDVIAHDASVRLMDGETSGEARNYPDFDIDTIVLDVLNQHKIHPGQVDSLIGSFQRTLTKKQGMTDYQFVKGLANLAGFEFKVYKDIDSGLWHANFRQPTSEQAKKYTFVYGGPTATLLSFEPQWGLRDMPTDVKVSFFDPTSRTFVDISAGGKSAPGEDPLFSGKLSDMVKQEITSMSRLRVAASGVAIEIIPTRPFDREETAIRYVEEWLKRRHENFITGHGSVAGLEFLRVGDVHVLVGLGVQLSGEWQFTTVRHVMQPGSAYVSEVFAHKLVSF